MLLCFLLNFFNLNHFKFDFEAVKSSKSNGRIKTKLCFKLVSILFHLRSFRSYVSQFYNFLPYSRQQQEVSICAVSQTYHCLLFGGKSVRIFLLHNQSLSIPTPLPLLTHASLYRLFSAQLATVGQLSAKEKNKYEILIHAQMPDIEVLKI